MTTISAKIIRDSISPEGIRLTTIHMRYPRFIHAELMTHRVFSRNARSSRAVPVETMLREIETDPVIPLFWGANQRGMQADVECDSKVDFVEHHPEHDQDLGRTVSLSRTSAWMAACTIAVQAARAFAKAGYHKQVVNRLIEPFAHIDVLVSSTDWANFLALRDHPMAEPHIAVLAREVRRAMDSSTPGKCGDDCWHLPYFDDTEGSDDMVQVREYCESDEVEAAGEEGWIAAAIKVSVARCARISYRPFDGNGDVESEIARHDQLVSSTPMHASPAEHQARVDGYLDVIDDNETGSTEKRWLCPEEHGNFRGWCQYRKMLPGEYVGG